MTAHANRGEFVLESERVMELSVRVLKRAKVKLRFEHRNFGIMGNHIHLMLRPTGSAGLSRITQGVLSVFASAFTRIPGPPRAGMPGPPDDTMELGHTCCPGAKAQPMPTPRLPAQQGRESPVRQTIPVDVWPGFGPSSKHRRAMAPPCAAAAAHPPIAESHEPICSTHTGRYRR